MNAYEIVDAFEETVAEYAGARYGVAVNSCTSALMLSCRLRLRTGFYILLSDNRVSVPRFTYVGVAQAIKEAGGYCEFTNAQWVGGYWLSPLAIFDGARRFSRGMYSHGLHCLSFHAYKHINIGRGGMILTDDIEERDHLRKMRHDGRTPGVAPKDDIFTPGWHVGLTPEEAARGLMLMANAKDRYEDLPWDEYADLSKTEWFTKPGGLS